MTACVSREGLQICLANGSFLSSFLHASPLEPAEHTTASQSLCRFSRAESPQGPPVSFVRVSRSKHREVLERLPEVFPMQRACEASLQF